MKKCKIFYAGVFCMVLLLAGSSSALIDLTGTQKSIDIYLDDLEDCNVPDPNDGNCLLWNGGLGEWTADDPEFEIALGDLDDVNVDSPNDDDSLTWDDATGKWIPEAVSGGTGFWNMHSDNLYSDSDAEITFVNDTLIVGNGVDVLETAFMVNGSTTFNVGSNRLNHMVITGNGMILDVDNVKLPSTVKWGYGTIMDDPITYFLFPNSATMRFFQNDNNVIDIGNNNIIFNKNNTDYDYKFETVNYDDTFSVDGGLDAVKLMRGIQNNVTFENSDLVITSAMNTIMCDTTSSNVTLWLPSIATVEDMVLFIIDSGGSAGTNNIDIDPNGADTIDDETSFTLSNDDETIRLFADSENNNWIVVGGTTRGILDRVRGIDQSVNTNSDVQFNSVQCTNVTIDDVTLNYSWDIYVDSDGCMTWVWG